MISCYKLFFVVFLFAAVVQLRPANEVTSSGPTEATTSTTAATTTTTTATTTKTTTTSTASTRSLDDDNSSSNDTSNELGGDSSQDSNSSDVDSARWTSSSALPTTSSLATPTTLSPTTPGSQMVTPASHVIDTPSLDDPPQETPIKKSDPTSSHLHAAVEIEGTSPTLLNSSGSASTHPPAVTEIGATSSTLLNTSQPASTTQPHVVVGTESTSTTLFTASDPDSTQTPAVFLTSTAVHSSTSSTYSSTDSSTDSSEESEEATEESQTVGPSTRPSVSPRDDDDDDKSDDDIDDQSKEDKDDEDDDDEEDLLSEANATSTTARTTTPDSHEDWDSWEKIQNMEISIASFRKVESATVGDQDLIMECNFTSESVDGIRITWLRHGMSIHSRSYSRFRITVKKYGDQEMLYTQLRITHACMSDTGPYACFAFRGFKKAYQAFDLVVYDIAKLAIYPPVLSLRSRHHKVVFWCKVTNPDDVLQSSDFKWQVNGKTPTRGFSRHHGVKESNGTIEFSPQEMAGNCTCFVGRSHTTAYYYVITTGMITCPEEIDKHGIAWPLIPAGRQAIAYCPRDHTGLATRKCGSDGQWAEPANLLDCVLDSLQNIDYQVQDIVDGTANVTVGTVLEGLLTIACNGSECEQLDGAGNLDKTVDILEKVSAIEDADVTQNDAEVFSSVLDALLDKRTGQEWNRVTQRDNRKPTRLLRTVRRIGRSAGRHLTRNSSLPIRKTNIDILVSRVSYRDLVFPEYSPARTSWMFLHADSLENIAENIGPEENSSVTKELLYVAACYKTIASLLPNNSAEAFLGQNINGTWTINSEVLSLSFGIDHPSVNLLRPLILHFKNADVNLSRPVCSFWDFDAENNEGAWSNAGCELDEKASNSTDTVCRCHHLTNFAVLMSPYRSSSHDDIALSIITYIGCGLSVLGCLVTLIVYLRLWRYLKSTRAHLLMQLCAVLIVFYIIFLAGIERTSDVVACKAVALVLHFLLLVAFFQMLALGVEIAVTVTYVFSATRSKLCYLVLLAWGFPLAIVIATAAVTNLEGYGGSICWLSLESGLLFAFVGPALLVILTNSVVLVIVLRAVYSTAVMTTKTKQEKIKAGVRNICVLLPSMGLTWVFGTLAVNDGTVVFEYIFAVCNCLQGVFIFIFYCFLNSSVREGVQRLRQRHEVSKNVYSDETKPHRSVKSLFGFGASNNGAEHVTSDSDNSKKSSLNLSSSVPGESCDTASDTNMKLEFPPGGFRYRDSWSGQSYPVPCGGQSSECPVRPSDYDADYGAPDGRETADKRKVGKVSFDGVRRHSDINNYSHRQNKARDVKYTSERRADSRLDRK